jgi:hypothetical protein
LLRSQNPSKKKSLQELRISEFTINCFDAQSQVHSKPIGFEIIRGTNEQKIL